MTILIGRLCAVTGTVTGTLPSFLLYHLIHILDQHSFQYEPFVVINVRLNATYLLFHKPLLNLSWFENNFTCFIPWHRDRHQFPRPDVMF